MIPVKVEGVRRNFAAVSAFLYHVFLLDEAGQRLLMFGIERHEALPIVVALNKLTLLRQESINLMAETLQLLNYTLEEVRIESYSILPPLYHLCKCKLSFRNGETVQKQTKNMRIGAAIGLALLMEASLLISDELSEQMGVQLVEGQTPELLFARYLLYREGIPLPEGKQLRLGYSKTPLRDALVKEFKTSLSGKAPIFPEEDMEQRKKEYLDFVLERTPMQNIPPICPPDLSSRPFHLTTERTMRAAPDVLFRAWTEQIDRWFAAPGTVIMKGEVNSVFFWETHFQDQRYPHYGRFLRLDRDRLIEMTWLTGAGGTKGAETVVKVELAPDGTGTHLQLTHSGFPDQEARDQHAQAWPMILAQLDERSVQ